MPLGWLGLERSWPPHPPANLPLGPLPASCVQAPVGPACEEAVVANLDSARRQLGLGPYDLPSNFTSLAPARQLLVLTNLDRLAYGLAPVAGLNAELDESALEGVEQLSDPLPPVELLPGTAVWGFTSNWAGNFPNAPAAYYEWMYDDGYGGANAACTSAGAGRLLGTPPRRPVAVSRRLAGDGSGGRDRRVRRAGLCDGDRLHARLAVARLLLHVGPDCDRRERVETALEPLRGAPLAAQRAGGAGSRRRDRPRTTRSQRQDSVWVAGARRQGRRCATPGRVLGCAGLGIIASSRPPRPHPLSPQPPEPSAP